MRRIEATYVNLVHIARSDGNISAREVRLLVRYGEVLGLPPSFVRRTARRAELEPVDLSAIDLEPTEKVHILRAMVRVASVEDGEVCRRERRIIQRLASSMGVGEIEFAEIVVGVEHEMRSRHRVRRRQLVVAASVVVVAVLAWAGFRHLSSRASREEENVWRIEQLLDRTDETARKQARLAGEQVRQSRLALDEREQRLARRLGDLERRVGKVAGGGGRPRAEDGGSELRLEIDRLRRQLAGIREPRAMFKQVVRDYGASVVLVFAGYELVKGQDRRRKWGTGTGFFVTSSGHIVTNKHVVQAWKFKAEAAKLIAEGYHVNEGFSYLVAWPAGSRVRRSRGARYDETAAYATNRGNLRLLRIAPDHFSRRTKPLANGKGSFTAHYHDLDQGDLAILEADVERPVQPLRLEVEVSAVEKLDPVMVLGFPRGFSTLEGLVAESSSAIGVVRKVEETIQVTAPIVPGNSGGPLFDALGRVIGVSTLYYDDATLGGCIPSQHILPLLPSSAELVREALGHLADGHPRAALDDLDVASLRAGDAATRRRVDAARAKVEEIRRGLLERARELEEVGSIGEARGVYQEVVRRFGPRWGREARAWLERWR